MASCIHYRFQTLIKRHESSIQATVVTDFMCTVYANILQPTSDIEKMDPDIHESSIQATYVTNLVFYVYAKILLPTSFIEKMDPNILGFVLNFPIWVYIMKAASFRRSPIVRFTVQHTE